jgi:hypothetical protein
MADVQEIPLSNAEEVQDIAEDIAEQIKAEEGSEAAVLEEAKPAKCGVFLMKPCGRRQLKTSSTRSSQTWGTLKEGTHSRARGARTESLPGW